MDAFRRVTGQRFDCSRPGRVDFGRTNFDDSTQNTTMWTLTNKVTVCLTPIWMKKVKKGKMSTATCIPRRSPIQVLTGLNLALLQLWDENWCIQDEWLLTCANAKILDPSKFERHQRPFMFWEYCYFWKRSGSGSPLLNNGYWHLGEITILQYCNITILQYYNITTYLAINRVN